MELAIAFGAIIALSLAVGLPAIRRQKTQKQRRGGSLGSAMFAMNEIFHPAAHSSIQIVDEQKEARKAMPSPEDK
jgi:type II secretory pathway component PulJ